MKNTSKIVAAPTMSKTTNPRTTGPITLTDSTATSTSRFYRVRGE